MLRAKLWTGALLAVVLASCGSGSNLHADVTLIRDPGSVAAGAVLFEANCALCHAADLTGGTTPSGERAPSLANKTGSSDASLTETAKRGRGLGMPSFEDQLEEAEIASIIDFIRSVQTDGVEE